jgi:DNA-binding LacI/PurR family transcriptional regulator
MASTARNDNASNMRDVARAARVSHQTVSRVLNNLPHVGATTRQRVESAIEELGYRPNPSARSLRTRSTRTVGVLTASIPGSAQMQGLLGAERVARRAGYFVCPVALPEISIESVEHAVEQFARQPVVGVINLLAHQEVIETLHRTQPPFRVISVGWSSDDDKQSVGTSQRIGARAGVKHLIEQGHTRIGHLSGPSGWNESTERLLGWQDALRESRLQPRMLIRGDWTAQRGYAAAAEIALDGSVTAMFVANDQMALGLIRGLHDSGLKLPQDMGIVAYGDQPEWANLLPPLTAVRHDFEADGSLCMETLLGDGATYIHREPMPRPILVIRSSSPRLPEEADCSRSAQRSGLTKQGLLTVHR